VSGGANSVTDPERVKGGHAVDGERDAGAHLTECGRTLEDQNPPPGLQQGNRGREAGDPTADHDCFQLTHGAPSRGGLRDQRRSPSQPDSTTIVVLSARLCSVPPPRNEQRRAVLADSAIAVLADHGIHQLTHRNVDRHARVPLGTTANYFPQRDELLDAAAHRIVDLVLKDTSAATDALPPRPLRGHQLANLLGDSLYLAATQQRARYLAIYELLLEATRRPHLRSTLAAISAATEDATLALHRQLGLRSTRAEVQAVTTLYGGALFALVTTVSPDGVTRADAHALARHISAGVLGDREFADKE
jgi:DNA-binding transcriptional regulator YbjK